MNLTDDLERLQRMHDGGGLSDGEFAQAKHSLLTNAAQGSVAHNSAPVEVSSLAQVANRYVSAQIVLGIAVLVMFLVFVFTVIVPSLQQSGHMTSSSGPDPVQIVGRGKQ